MKKVFSFIGIVVGTILIVQQVFAQGPVWTKTYGGTSDDYGYSVQECASGGFIIAGYTISFGAISADVYLIRTDSDGDTLWTKTYGGTGWDYGYSVQECASGGFIIAGRTRSFGAGYYDVYLIRTNSEGDTLWTKTYGGTNYDWGYSVQECAGGFIIAGETASFGAGSGFYLIRTDADGDTLWTQTYGGTSSGRGESVQECEDGGFIIAGETQSFGAGSYDVYLIRTNANGDTLWTKTYGGTGWDWGESVQRCTDGGFIIAGYTGSFGAGDYDVYLIRTDSDGDTLWTKTYGGTDADWGYSVQECIGGGFIIAGETKSFGADYDVYLIRTDSDGDTLWTKTYGGTGWDEGFSVQECASGGFIIAGYTRSFDADSGDVWVIKTDSLGNTIMEFSVLSPDGGEYWLGNSVHPVEWNIVKIGSIAKFRLLYSTDGGGTYSDTIAANVPSDADAWDWKLPNIDCNTCRVKVEALGSGDEVLGYAQSPADFTIIKAGIEESAKCEVKSVKLEVYPNLSTTVVRVQWLGVNEGQKVSLKVYDLGGRLVKTLLNNKVISGNKIEVRLDELTKGIYFVKMESGSFTATKKMILMR